MYPCVLSRGIFMISLHQNRTVLTYGVFDVFGAYHVENLAKIRRHGDQLIVGCATDALCSQSNIRCQMSFDHRRRVLEACRTIDRVIPVSSWDQYRTDIVNTNTAVFAMPDHWDGLLGDLDDLVQVVFFPSPASAAPARMHKLRAG